MSNLEDFALTLYERPWEDGAPIVAATQVFHAISIVSRLRCFALEGC